MAPRSFRAAAVLLLACALMGSALANQRSQADSYLDDVDPDVAAEVDPKRLANVASHNAPHMTQSSQAALDALKPGLTHDLDPAIAAKLDIRLVSELLKATAAADSSASAYKSSSRSSAYTGSSSSATHLKKHAQ
jgi:hypothetical protein